MVALPAPIHLATHALPTVMERLQPTVPIRSVRPAALVALFHGLTASEPPALLTVTTMSLPAGKILSGQHAVITDFLTNRVAL